LAQVLSETRNSVLAPLLTLKTTATTLPVLRVRRRPTPWGSRPAAGPRPPCSTVSLSGGEAVADATEALRTPEVDLATHRRVADKVSLTYRSRQNPNRDLISSSATTLRASNTTQGRKVRDARWDTTWTRTSTLIPQIMTNRRIWTSTLHPLNHHHIGRSARRSPLVLSRLLSSGLPSMQFYRVSSTASYSSWSRSQSSLQSSHGYRFYPNREWSLQCGTIR
jgi:hypothetical protein